MRAELLRIMKAAHKPYRIYLRDIAEAAIEQMIPAEEK